MFNDYVWKTYLNAGGKDVVAAFERSLSGAELSEDYAGFINTLHSAYCPSRAVLERTKGEIIEACAAISEDAYLLGEGNYTILSAMEELYEGLQGDEKLSAKMVFDYFSGGIAYYTTLLAYELPELFVPYYFSQNFNMLQRIADEFDINLLEIPNKKDYEDRFYYYAAICVALYDFRAAHGMSPYELCAFLYDFAPKYIGGVDSYIIKDLPEPRSAFFIGGSKDDAFLRDNADEITCWQCSPDTRAGDMIVMYLRSPISAVDSVWRSVSLGFNDPFFYYYRCTYIANPVKMKRISQSKLQKDPVLKSMPIVRKNMQGINGVELKPSEYNHLVDLGKADILKLQFAAIDENEEFVNERDVENKLIKPLIAKLGYEQEEYTQQMRIEIGNHNTTLIPDFVLMPVTARGRQSGFALIEAKHTIPNEKEMEEVRIQARSYARQLNVEYSVIASKDKVWVFSPKDGFVAPIFESPWTDLNDADVFSQLFKMIGKKAK